MMRWSDFVFLKTEAKRMASRLPLTPLRRTVFVLDVVIPSASVFTKPSALKMERNSSALKPIQKQGAKIIYFCC